MTEHQAHDPIDLMDELDAVIRENELLIMRMSALQARYEALQGQADAGRFDKLDASGWVEVHGDIEVKYTARGLRDAVENSTWTTQYLRSARELAANVREYPQAAERDKKWFESDQGWSR